MVNADLRRIAQDAARVAQNTAKVANAAAWDAAAEEIIKNDESLQVEYARYLKMCIRMLTK